MPRVTRGAIREYEIFFLLSSNVETWFFCEGGEAFLHSILSLPFYELGLVVKT